MVTKRKPVKSRTELIGTFAQKSKSGDSTPAKTVKVIRLGQRYRAIVQSTPTDESGYIDMPVARVLDASIAASLAKNKYGVGKPAPTRFKLSTRMFEKLAMEIAK